MNAAKKIVVNADDFGFSEGVTDGILESHKRGVLTSTTLMTTMPDCDRAIDLGLATPTLGVGIHLCLTQGKPLTKCSRLANKRGELPRGVPRLWWKLLSQAARQEAEQEWTAQVDYAIRRGLKPTHLDSHKHIHHLPALQEIVLTVAGRFGIKWVRCAREIGIGDMKMSMGYKRLVKLASEFSRKMESRNLKCTNWFFGLATTGRTTSAIWKQLCGNMPPGLGEVMVHPGYQRGITKADTRLLQGREDEMNALVDPEVRGAVERAGIELTHYGRL